MDKKAKKQLKEFLKPTKGKIALFIFFGFLVLLYIGRPFSDPVFWFVALPILITPSGLIIPEAIRSIFLMLIMLIQVIYLYIISCVVVHIINRIKNSISK